ncbi:MAG TPA: alpha/beta hydrolase-fold protein [Streptosporangiaceae bacterium]|nr:alpha/beta hydrolase-fold protein [Streptosporangiaceae bacterium]
MLEPQSTVLFVLLVVAFGALLWWMLTARYVAVRVLAAFLAFIPAMTFGIAVVNKYYDYYQSWGAAVADLTNQGAPATTVSASGNALMTGFSALDGHHMDTAIARQFGLTLRLNIHGPTSGITRLVYVFLPPQYFWPGHYQKYRFPVVELLHGFPGQPSDWITVLGVNQILDSLVSAHRAKPAVLVIPDANGGLGVSLQCLNQSKGPQDDTYLARDLPAYIARELRVQPPGLGWGIAGYSEGGFCAANLGLQHGREYSYAGVLSGYFQPSDNQLMNPTRRVGPFGGNRLQAQLNNPLDLLRSLPIGRPVPQFWLGAGLQDPGDVQSAQTFGQLLQIRQPAVTLRLVPGSHTMPTWRKLLPPMLGWMTRGLARQVSIYNSPAARARRAAVAAAAAKAKLLGQRPRRQQAARRPQPRKTAGTTVTTGTAGAAGPAGRHAPRKPA